MPVFLGSVLMKPLTVCFCQPVASTISCNVAPPARSSMSLTIACLLNARGTRGVLAPGAGVGASAAALAALLPFAFFAGLVAAWGAGVAAWGAGAASSFWIAAQMRAVALVRFSNFFTGFSSPKGGAPAKLFQTSTRRLIGHSAVALLSSLWLANTTRLSCAAGTAAWAVMLLSVSIVNVVIVVLLGWERLGAPRSRSSMADRGRQPDVVAFQTLRPQLVLLDGGAGVVAPVAFPNLARLADADRHPYRAVAAACVHRDQDRIPDPDLRLFAPNRTLRCPRGPAATRRP